MPILTKRQVEVKYVEMAQSAGPIIPRGKVVPGDSPDVRIQTNSGVLGVEVTRLYPTPLPGEKRAPMGKRGLRHGVVDTAKSRYEEKGGPPISVEVFFSTAKLPEQWKEASAVLAQLVRERAPELTARGKAYPFGVDAPNGFQHINICRPLSGRSEWIEARENDRPQELQYDHVERVVAEKDRKLVQYESMELGTRLLMLVDPFPRAAWLCLPAEVESWKFASRFGKVLLFSREKNRVFDFGKL